MKLQLYQQTISDGERHQALYNDGEGRRGLIDARIGSLFAIPPGSEEVLTMLAATSHGVYLYAIEPLTRRAGDYRALVLYIPRQALLAAMRDIGDMHEALLKATACRGDGSEMARWMEIDYPATDLHIDASTSPHGYATMACDRESMAASLTHMVLQSAVANYEGVFLLTPATVSWVKKGTMQTFGMTAAPPRIAVLSDVRPTDAEQHKDTKNEKSSSTDGALPSRHPAKMSRKLAACLATGFVAGALLGYGTCRLTHHSASVVADEVTVVADTVETADTVVHSAYTDSTDIPMVAEPTDSIENNESV